MAHRTPRRKLWVVPRILNILPPSKPSWVCLLSKFNDMFAMGSGVSGPPPALRPPSLYYRHEAPLLSNPHATPTSKSSPGDLASVIPLTLWPIIGTPPGGRPKPSCLYIFRRNATYLLFLGILKFFLQRNSHSRCGLKRD